MLELFKFHVITLATSESSGILSGNQSRSTSFYGLNSDSSNTKAHAQAVEQNARAMSAFILQGSGATLQPGVLNRKANFLCKGFPVLMHQRCRTTFIQLYLSMMTVHPPQIYQVILDSWIRVSGRGINTVNGCPFRNIVVQDMVDEPM